MNRSSRTVLICCVVTAAIVAIPLTAQVTEPNGGLPHKLEGDAIPRYHLIRQFFEVAEVYFDDSQEARNHLMQALRLEGPAAEVALARALLEARQLRQSDSGPPDVLIERDGARTRTLEVGRGWEFPEGTTFSSDEERQTAIVQREVEKARSLAIIYRDLQQALQAAGSSTDGIEAYLRTKIATSMSIASDRPFDSKSAVHLTAREFERQLTEPE